MGWANTMSASNLSTGAEGACDICSKWEQRIYICHPEALGEGAFPEEEEATLPGPSQLAHKKPSAARTEAGRSLNLTSCRAAPSHLDLVDEV